MPRGYLQWVSPSSRQSADVVAFASAKEIETEVATAARAALPDPTEAMSTHDKTIFFLQTATEIEHSLLVQYLYGAFSLGDIDTRADLTEPQKNQARDWQRKIVFIARQEMGHLISVENLLRLIGGPLNFEREDFPFRGDYYPFPFQLEPLTKDSLAK